MIGVRGSNRLSGNGTCLCEAWGAVVADLARNNVPRPAGHLAFDDAVESPAILSGRVLNWGAV